MGGLHPSLPQPWGKAISPQHQPHLLGLAANQVTVPLSSQLPPTPSWLYRLSERGGAQQAGGRHVQEAGIVSRASVLNKLTVLTVLDRLTDAEGYKEYPQQNSGQPNLYDASCMFWQEVG